MSEHSRKTARSLEGWGTVLCIGGFSTLVVASTAMQPSGGWLAAGFLACLVGLAVFLAGFLAGRLQD